MIKQRHLIRRQVFEITVPNREAADRIHAELARIQREYVEDALDRILSEFVGPDQYLRIESLTLNLGQISMERWESQIVHQLRPSFAAALRPHLGRASPMRDSEHDRRPVGSLQELLTLFLRSGQLPWWADAAQSQQIEHTVSTLLDTEQSELVRLIRSVAGASGVLMRLVLHCSDGSLQRLLFLTLTKSQPSLRIISEELEQLVQLLRSRLPKLPSNSEIEWRTALWVGLLSAASREDRAHLGRSEFIEDALSQVAQSSGVSLPVLLHTLTERTEDDSPLPPDEIAAHAFWSSDSGLRAELVQLVQLLGDVGTGEEFRTRLVRLLEQAESPGVENLQTTEQTALHLSSGLSEVSVRDTTSPASPDVLTQGVPAEPASPEVLREYRDGSEDAELIATLPAESVLLVDGPGFDVDEGAAATAGADANRNQLLARHLPDRVLGTEFLERWERALEKVRSSGNSILHTLLLGELHQLLAEHHPLHSPPSVPQMPPLGPPPNVVELSPTVPSERVLQDLNPLPQSLDLSFSDTDEVHVENAGVVLLWPFLVHLFERLELMTDRRFRDRRSQLRAVGLMQHLATGERRPAEYQLPLAKVLCGMDVNEVLKFGPLVTDEESEECNNLLTATIEHARSFGSISITGLRNAFLIRKGVLRASHDSYHLLVERASHDVLIERLPWGLSWVKLPWMEVSLAVDW